MILSSNWFCVVFLYILSFCWKRKVQISLRVQRGDQSKYCWANMIWFGDLWPQYGHCLFLNHWHTAIVWNEIHNINSTWVYINSHIRSCDMCSTNGFYPSIFIHFSYFWLFPIFAKKSLSLQKVINWRKKFMPLTEISLIYAWAWALSPFRVF